MGNFSDADLEQFPFLENYTVPDYWIDKMGITDEKIPSLIKLALATLIGLAGISFILYILTWWVRKNISLQKRLGEEPMTCFENFSQKIKLGQEPSINFVSSTLITNDRVYIIMRVAIAIWSLTLTTAGWEGTRSAFFGAYFPMAACITVYVNFNREKIVEGFGPWMQFLNKILSFLFNCQAALRLVISISWWTRWIDLSRYRYMMRPLNMNRFLSVSKEYSPTIFLLVELLWFDTQVNMHGMINPMCAGAAATWGIMTGRPQVPQALAAYERDVAGSIVIMFSFFIGIALIHSMLAAFCVAKFWIFKKVPIIGQRLINRQNCIAIFRKRHELNKFLPASMLEMRKTTISKGYADFGRQTKIRQSMARKTAMRNSARS